MILTAALRHQAQQRDLAARAAATAVGLWVRTVKAQDLTGSYARILPTMLAFVVAQQHQAAAAVDGYLDQVLTEQDIDPARTATVVAAGFAGSASDGRDLSTLLLEPLIAVKSALGSGGLPLPDAYRQGISSLQRIVTTQVTDAGRTAAGAGIVARPEVDGYIRVLNPPSCYRCAILGGRFYRWNSGFRRHPHCDCTHAPTTEHLSRDLITDPGRAFAAGQVTGLSLSDSKAIRDGADMAKVVNAHRGMSTADVYGRDLKVTREAAQRGTGPRLRPESIYQIAGDDRAEALRLLRQYGYLR